MNPEVSMKCNASGLVPVLLGLGSNLGDRLTMLARAVAAVDALPGCRVEAVSSLYRTAPVESDGGEFLNAAARVSSVFEPEVLLAGLKSIEKAFGRTGSGHDARPVDIDIIFYGDLVLRDKVLTIPHPRWRERRFVMFPLLEVCGDQIDPHTGIPVRDICAAAMKPGSDVIPFARGDWWKAPPNPLRDMGKNM